MIIIMSKVVVKQDKGLEFISAVRDLINASRSYENCISYDFVKSFVTNEISLIEKWEDTDSLNEFVNSYDFINFSDITKDCIEGLDVNVYYSEEVNLM